MHRGHVAGSGLWLEPRFLQPRPVEPATYPTVITAPLEQPRVGGADCWMVSQVPGRWLETLMGPTIQRPEPAWITETLDGWLPGLTGF